MKTLTTMTKHTFLTAAAMPIIVILAFLLWKEIEINWLCGLLSILWIALAGTSLKKLYAYMRVNILGDVMTLLTFAILPAVGISYIATGSMDWSIVMAAVPAGLITTGCVHSRNIKDSETPGHRKASALTYAFDMLLPFVWVGICSLIGIMPAHTIIIFITLPIALGCSKTMVGSTTSGAEIVADMDFRSANMQVIFSVLLAASFIVARLF